MATTTFDLQRTVQALDDAFIRNANAKDGAALASAFYTDDAVLLPPNAPLVRGIQAIGEFWQAFFEAGTADVTIETAQVEESGDLAYGLGFYGVTLPRPEGGTFRDTGKYVVVYRRQGDSWRVAADTFNTDLPTS